MSIRKFLVLMAFAALAFGLSSCTNTSPIINFKQDRVQIEVKDENFSLNMLSMYIDATTYDGKKIPFNEIDVNGTVDVNTLGIYNLLITAEADQKTTVRKLEVEVVDTTAPVFHVVNDVIKVYRKESFDPDPLKNLIFVYDNNDGMITDTVTYEGDYKSGKVGEYPITYTATDSSGNSSSCTITYKICQNRDEFLHFIYDRTIDFYWGKYFVLDKDNRILNYDDALYYQFTNAGTAQFERSCGLQENTDGVETGVMLERKDDGVYKLKETGVFVNNYDSTEFYLVSEQGKVLNYRAVVTYRVDGKNLDFDYEFAMKKVSNKYYVEDFYLPTS